MPEMIELKLTTEKFHELIKKGYGLDTIFVLKMGEIGESLYPTPKVVALEQMLQRKGLTDKDGKITDAGKELLNFVDCKDTSITKIKRKKKELTPEVESDFLKWWKTYPASDTFEYKGKKFEGTRALRVKKNDCETKFNKILTSKEGYTIDELINALKLEISQKAENSIKTGTNKMSYFQNSLTYLNQATYDAYVELVRAGHKPKEVQKGATATNETYI